MIIGFNIAATALTAIQESLAINTSNISNAMTGAYKTRRAELENNFPFLLSDLSRVIHVMAAVVAGQKSISFENTSVMLTFSQKVVRGSF